MGRINKNRDEAIATQSNNEKRMNGMKKTQEDHTA
jgi:hypothetical protein